MRTKRKHHRRSWMYLLTCFVAFHVGGYALADEAYTQRKNIVYAETHGIGLVMDIFVPTGDKNGLAVIDVVSGSWSSSRGKLRDHERAQLFKKFCQHGYTIFAIRPGSVSKFSGLEMRDHLHLGMRWVKEHAADYQVDPDRYAMVGASAGGHLACLATVSAPKEIRPSAVSVFFPPTDLLAFAGDDLDLKGNGPLAKAIAAIGFNGRMEGVSAEEVRERLTQLSPARLVDGSEPPFLLIHGDADKVVPLKQSELMVKSLTDKGVDAKLIVKKNGGHPWFTIAQEVEVMADWLDERLRSEPEEK